MPFIADFAVLAGRDTAKGCKDLRDEHDHFRDGQITKNIYDINTLLILH